MSLIVTGTDYRNVGSPTFRSASGCLAGDHGLQNHSVRANPRTPAIRSTKPRSSTPIPGPEKNRCGLTKIAGTCRGNGRRTASADADTAPTARPARSGSPTAATATQTSALATSVKVLVDS